MNRASVMLLVLLIVRPLSGIDAQTEPPPGEREALKPMTVCEVLENLNQNAGKMVAVVGKLSWNMFDGSWLSEDGCDRKVPASDSQLAVRHLSCLHFRNDPAAGLRRQVES